MRVRQLENAAEFLALTRGYRATEPVRTNILGSIAQTIVDGRRYEREFWFVVEHEGAVVGAALWTLPHKLLLGPMPDSAARAVGATAVATGVPLNGVIGPLGTAEAAAEGAGARATPYMTERVLVLEDYVPPRAAVGAARRLTPSDVDLAVTWTDQFFVDAGVRVSDSRAAVLARLGSTWFWEVSGQPVAMAGHGSVVMVPGAVVARVGPVYTPAALRGLGYGSAITAAVVEHLLPLVDVVMLYTDAANPTSNAIYERLGFVHTADVIDLDLHTPHRPSLR